MKLFNIDMHISIIHDIKTLFAELGHHVESYCMSGHTWVNNEPQRATEVIHPGNFTAIDQDMCDRFYARYKEMLEEYDGFIHSYPPAFAMLFTRWNKPIYTIACTRYEYPCGSGGSHSRERLRWLNEGLIRGYKEGQIILIANNLYDKRYCEQFCGGEWKFIPSICRYIEHLTCNGSNGKFIVWERNRDGLKRDFTHPRVDHKFSMSQPYDRTTLVNYAGIIHIPYNISIMSAFEHYAMGIPMFVPSYDLLMSWKRQGRDVLSELQFPGNLNTPLSDEWVRLADWYDTDNMPGVMLFDSVKHLHELLDSHDRVKVTEQMKKFHAAKKIKVVTMWRETLREKC